MGEKGKKIYLFIACGTLVPQPGIEPESPAFKHGVLITGPPGESLPDMF